MADIDLPSRDTSLGLGPLRQARQLVSAGTSVDTILAHLQTRFSMPYPDAIATVATARTLDRHGLALAPTPVA